MKNLFIPFVLLAALVLIVFVWMEEKKQFKNK